MQYMLLVVCGLFLTVKFSCLFTAVAVLACLSSLRGCMSDTTRTRECCKLLDLSCELGNSFPELQPIDLMSSSKNLRN